jgi:hypothetical protein
MHPFQVRWPSLVAPNIARSRSRLVHAQHRRGRMGAAVGSSPCGHGQLDNRIRRLLSDAAECDLIGNLATDGARRTTFRRLAQEFRQIAEELKRDIDRRKAGPDQRSFRDMSDREFLLYQAREFRGLAAGTTEESIRSELLRLALDLEAKADAEQN